MHPVQKCFTNCAYSKRTGKGLRLLRCSSPVGSSSSSITVGLSLGGRPQACPLIFFRPDLAILGAMATPHEYQDAGTEYFRQYYELGVWKRQHYRGIRILKLPTDLWNYQEIFSERRIEWVVETGSAHGGSALYFADLLGLAAAPGKVITIDVSHAALQLRQHPRIEF